MSILIESLFNYYLILYVYILNSVLHQLLVYLLLYSLFHLLFSIYFFTPDEDSLLCFTVPCVSYRCVHFSRAVLFCQPHQQLLTHVEHTYDCICGMRRVQQLATEGVQDHSVGGRNEGSDRPTQQDVSATTQGLRVGRSHARCGLVST